MKIRSDFVSNSSSSSFVVRDKSPEATKLFHDDFNEFVENVYEPFGETMNVRIKLTKDKDNWDYMSYDDLIKEIVAGNLDYKDIYELSFDCDDWDSTGIMYLNFLYKYFQCFGLNPDDSNTEHEFRGSDSNGGLLNKLLNRISDKTNNSEDEK